MGIKMLYPDFSSDVTSSAGGEASRYNLRYASRQAILRTLTSSASYTITFDFGSAVTVDYCFVGGINNAIQRASVDGNNDSITLTFLADDNSSFTSPESDTVNLQLSDLMGLPMKDYVKELSFTTDYRYYRLKIDTINADTIPLYLSKCWFGEMYDLGKMPNLPIPVTYKVTPVYHEKTFTFIYQGLEEADRLSLYNNLDKYKLYKPVVLYDPNDYFLNGEKLAYCRVVDVNYDTRVDGIYNARVDFITDY